jgi:hypothetical protein
MRVTGAVRNAADILGASGIRLKSTAPGRYYSICPECSYRRKKPHQKLQCLGVTITGEGVKFGCNHCGWTGGGFYERRSVGTKSIRMPRRCSTGDRPTSDDDAVRRSAFALQIWSQATNPRGTPSGRYLASRGLELPDEVAGTVIAFTQP